MQYIFVQYLITLKGDAKTYIFRYNKLYLNNMEDSKYG
jgi:hypothetical protein